MKKTIKIVAILMIAFMLVFTLNNFVFADGTTGDAIVSGITPDTSTVNATGMQEMAGKVLGIIQIATAILAVILIAVFGFKFVLGSAQEKADYQKSFIPLIVGVIVVFAATSIARLIFSIIGQ